MIYVFENLEARVFKISKRIFTNFTFWGCHMTSGGQGRLEMVEIFILMLEYWFCVLSHFEKGVTCHIYCHFDICGHGGQRRPEVIPIQPPTCCTFLKTSDQGYLEYQYEFSYNSFFGVVMASRGHKFGLAGMPHTRSQSIWLDTLSVKISLKSEDSLFG